MSKEQILLDYLDELLSKLCMGKFPEDQYLDYDELVYGGFNNWNETKVLFIYDEDEYDIHNRIRELKIEIRKEIDKHNEYFKYNKV